MPGSPLRLRDRGTWSAPPPNCDLHGHVTIWLDGVNDDGSSRNAEVDGEDFTHYDVDLVAEAPSDLAFLLDRIAPLETEKAVTAESLARFLSETPPGGSTVESINVRAGAR